MTSTLRNVQGGWQAQPGGVFFRAPGQGEHPVGFLPAFELHPEAQQTKEARDAAQVVSTSVRPRPELAHLIGLPNAASSKNFSPRALLFNAQGNACVSAFTPSAPCPDASAPAPPWPGVPVTIVVPAVGSVAPVYAIPSE